MTLDANFFVSLFNIDMLDVDSLFTRTTGETTTFEITLKRRQMDCPYCSGPMIGHGHKTKKIDHPIIRNCKGIILYHANRCICKEYDEFIGILTN